MDEGVIIIPCIVFLVIGILLWNFWMMVIPGMILSVISIVRIIEMRKEEKRLYEEKFKNNVNKS